MKIFWWPEDLNLALHRASITWFWKDMMTWPLWTLTMCPGGFQRHSTYLSGARQPQHRTTSCWYRWWGWGGVALGYENHLCHSFSPCTCWQKYRQSPGLQRRAAHIHLTSCGHIVGTHSHLPSSAPGQRCGYWHQGHFCRSETLGMFCSYNTGNTMATPGFSVVLQRKRAKLNF